MIGIYEDSFKDYLIENLGDSIQIKSKNIVSICPWCEMGKSKKHYHLWISIEIPIWHCFKPNCPSGGGGGIKKLIKKLSGKDISEKFVDKEKFKNINRNRKSLSVNDKLKNKFLFPSLKENIFPSKSLYIKQRLKFTKKDISSINGLVFDINEFVKINNIKLSEKIMNMSDFLHNNFIGIVTKHQSCMVLRNINSNSSFAHFKMQLQNHDLLDYYRLNGNNPNCDNIVLSEGIFDIFTEQIFKSINIENVKLYAAGLSVSYDSLIKSISFDEIIFKPNIHILSDRDVHLNYYKKIKRENNFYINNMIVYYNRCGKDFNDTPVMVERFII